MDQAKYGVGCACATAHRIERDVYFLIELSTTPVLGR